MFKQLDYSMLAEILLVLLNDDQLEDMQDVSECFVILLRNTKTPKYRFKTNLEFMVAAPKLYCLYGNAEDYLFDVTNTHAEVTQQMLEHYLSLTITTGDENKF